MGSGIIELGEILLARSERRLETVSRNVSNISTPGFKREVPFAEAIAGLTADGDPSASTAPDLVGDHSSDRGGSTYPDFAQGTLRLTGAPLDLAITGPGFFQVRSGDQVFYIRGGQFDRRPDGRVSTAQGFVLQTVSGGDLVLETSDVEILGDGVVLEGGAPIAQIGVFGSPDNAGLASTGGGLFSAPTGGMAEVKTPSVRQGMLEASNVELADEMLTMMDALRQAESGARLIQLYDSLVGQSVTTFGQTSR